MAERRNRRPHALELPELNGLSFPLTKLGDRQTAEIHIRVALINRFNTLGTADVVRLA